MATKLPRITYEDKKDYKVIEQDPTYCISAKDMNDIKNTFNQSAGMIEKAVDTSNQTNQTINEKIEDGSFIPQATAGTVEMTQPGTKAEVTITGDKKTPEFNFKIPKDEVYDLKDIFIVMEEDSYIPPEKRKTGRLYFNTTDKVESGFNNEIRVSPNMGLKKV